MRDIWLSHYPPGVPHEINTNAYANLLELCANAWQRFPEHPAFGNFSSYLSFAEVDRYSSEFAAYLRGSLGLDTGDRVAIMMPNILSYPLVMLGILRAGCVVVNTNPQYTPRELQHQLTDSGAKCVVVFKSMLGNVCEVIGSTAVETLVTTEIGDFFPFPKSAVFNRIARKGRQKFSGKYPIEVTSLRRALKLGSETSFTSPTLGPDNLAFLQYTGGTTGVSKGAMLSHGNIVSNVLQVESWFSDSIDAGKEIVITALPLYHIYALTVNCLSFLHQGGLNYLITDPTDTNQFVKELSQVKFTGIAGVNTLFKSLLAHEKIGDVDFSTLKYSSGGGAAIQTRVANEWKNLTGKTISEGYGLTEASPVVCVNPFELNEFTGCIGLPVPSTNCRIVTECGRDAAIGEAGELYVRGPQVMQGYWQQPSETAAVLSHDGWLRTGDIALMREDGYFKIVDRKKDMILVSGFNVYPNEIEDIVVSHPGVNDVAAIGVPDEKTTEAVKIVVVRSDPNIGAADLIAYCREQLTGYKIPRYVEFADDLPKSNIGKILRRSVKEKFGTTV